MNILIIVANNREESFSHAMAKRYQEIATARGDIVEFVDLYKDKQQAFFAFEGSWDSKASQEVRYFQEKITIADELVFCFPYWWGSMPAILKNFIDCNFTSGYAFKYENGMPKGLLQGKSAKFFVTTGAPKFWYTLTGANRRLKNMFKEQIINFCGIKLSSFTIFGGVDSSKNKEKLSAYLDAIK